MKKLIVLSLLCIGFSAEAGTGCLVKEGKKMRIDPGCKCLGTNSCAKATPIPFNKKFFDSRTEDNKPVFKEKEKIAFEKSNTIFNKIMELKSVGKGDTEEIKKLYFELDKLNSEISVLLHKNHPQMMAAFKKRYEEKSKKRKLEHAETEKAIRAFVKSKSAPGAKTSTVAAVKQDSAPIVSAGKKETAKPAKPVESVNTAGANIESPGRFNDYDKRDIVQKLDKEKTNVNEDDSLFDIISKAYRGKAYKRLWAPSDVEESQNKTPTP